MKEVITPSSKVVMNLGKPGESQHRMKKPKEIRAQGNEGGQEVWEMGDGGVGEASEASSRERPLSALGGVGAHESCMQRFGTYSFRYISTSDWRFVGL